MEKSDIIVTETRRNIHTPQVGITDIISIVSLMIIGVLLIMNNPVPEYLVALVTLGAGIRVNLGTPAEVGKL
jgi:hypothetical protein